MTARYPSHPDWTPEERETWDRIANCDHDAFWSSNPRPTEDTCVCGGIVRTVTTAEGWADHWAEQRAEEKAWDRAQLRARMEDARW